ncbi:tubulin-specific chaperone [Grosmannia clavigera kw1407]|uniref:Tubulin-specific chaperone n=1 Tax=Grosmannia clavigera (strain kw1407 / UAMH 11150) TaxID=655863 RepID=F0X8T7_GROCL|nr:tubulin-specific chaperone [Grosmannia clavigera kw1407]EFX05880.1 tubulin-specific chaperone [Grosmannia clavigera kw1407]
MDAADEDADVRLQKVSNDLLSEFDGALGSFLRRPGSKKTETDSTLRTHVRAREAYHLIGLIDQFQELPQLLDGYLARWLPELADAFLGCVAQAPKAQAPLSSSSPTSLVMSLQAAVARLLYTFCKVRGEKVVVGFLPVETRYLERLLGALEAQERRGGEDGEGRWTWEERYVVLLWLAQLFLAPFDLSTISTGRAGDEEGDESATIEGFVWPSGDQGNGNSNSSRLLPSITVRVLPLAIGYLAAPGKEQDAARALLVRVAMRRDMQELGVRHALILWALHSLRPLGAQMQTPTSRRPSYYYIGTLSFLAGILSAAAGASDMDDALASIFAAVHAVAESEGQDADVSLRDDAVFVAIRSSALARKMMIKAVRAIAVRYIQLAAAGQAGEGEGDAIIETTIGYLLDRLADNDTPVRFAASKALSVIALQLDADMAAQVIDAVLEGLERNVLRLPGSISGSGSGGRDLTAVDPLEWHGLMLTLAHLLYRRSPPLAVLPAIVASLQVGLAFERRSVSGSATGTNVRDAACFGVWALARRYTTAELQPLAVLQPLATDLVVAACLDPAGNIRRGSSAALQELVGRHPDTVCAGIALVLAVDYHAVALRSRAVADVALQAAALARDPYGSALRDELLGWRGVGDAGDAAARRGAATAFGHIAQRLAADGPTLCNFLGTASMLTERITKLQPRQVEERHGLLLALAAVLDTFPALVQAAQTLVELPGVCQKTICLLHRALQSCKILALATTTRRLELLAEASSRLIVSSFPVLQATSTNDGNKETKAALISGPELVSEANHVPATAFGQVVQALTGTLAPQDDIRTVTDLAASLLSDVWLARREPEVVDAASDAALILLVVLFSTAARHELVCSWAATVRQPAATLTSKTAAARSTSRGSSGSGFVFALTKAYPLVALGDTSDEDPISRAILDRWASDRSIEARVSLLQALAQSPAVLMMTAPAPATATANPGRFRTILAAGLDDYTTDARAATSGRTGTAASGSLLFLRVLRLAAEKLDRVRTAAQPTLALALGEPASSRLLSLTFSSQAYFRTLLGLWDEAEAGSLGPIATAAAAGKTGDTAAAVQWMAALMRGYVTSADTGNEELVIASRAALVDYVGQGDAAATRRKRRLIWLSLLRNLPGGTTTTTTTTTTGKPKVPVPPDRIVVPTLEIVAFLFYSGVFGRSVGEDDSDSHLAALCRQVYLAAEKAGSVRKLEACIKVYGAVAAVTAETADSAGPVARQRLAALLRHPWPRIRNAVVDELWGLGLGLELGLRLERSPSENEDRGGGLVAAQNAQLGQFDALKGTDWGSAEAEAVDALVGRLGLGIK